MTTQRQRVGLLALIPLLGLAASAESPLEPPRDGTYEFERGLYESEIRAAGESDPPTLPQAQALADLATKWGEPRVALEVLERGCATVLADGSTDVATALSCASRLAGLHGQLGEWSKAEARWRETLSLSGRPLGSDRPDSPYHLLSLSSVLVKQGGCSDEAESLVRRSFTGRPESDRLRGLTEYALHCGDPRRAIEYAAELLRLESRTTPPHAKVPIRMLMAQAQVASGMPEAAESSFISALHAAESRYGPESATFELLDVLTRFGTFELERGRLTEAERWLVRAERLSRKRYGACTKCGRPLYEALGKLSALLHRPIDVCPPEELAIPEASPPSKRSKTTKRLALHRKSVELFAKLDFTASRQAAVAALELAEAEFGRDSPESLDALEVLSALAVRLGLHGDQALLLERRRRILEQKAPADDLRLAYVLSTRLAGREVPETVAQNLERAAAIFEAHEVCMSALDALVNWYGYLPADAEPRRRAEIKLRIADLHERVLGRESAEWVQARVELAMSYVPLGLLDDAESELTRLHEFERSRAWPETPAMRAVLVALRDVKTLRGNAAGADEVARELDALAATK